MYEKTQKKQTRFCHPLSLGSLQKASFLAATTEVPDFPFAGGSHKPKNLKNSKKKKKLFVLSFTYLFLIK